MARIQRTLATTDNASDVAATDGNVACAARFEAIATALRAGALERYRQHLHRHLAAQEKSQLTQRALLDTVEQVYSAALDELAGLPFETAAIPVERGRSGLTPALLLAFEGFNAAPLDGATHYNRTSCAVSNFPLDHKPEADYVDAIARDLATAWREFALNLNGVLLGKGRADAQGARIG